MRFWILIFFFFTVVNTILGQGLFTSTKTGEETDKAKSPIHWESTLQTSIWTLGKDYPLSQLSSIIHVGTSYKKERIKAKFDLRIRNGWIFNTPINEINLREAWLSYELKHWTFKIGNQIPSWGKVEIFNPSDYHSARDYFYLSSDEKEKKLASFIFHFNYHPNPKVKIEANFIPIPKISKYRYDLFFDNQDISVQPFQTGSYSINQSSFSLRSSFYLNSSTFSLSIFNGYETMPSLKIDSILWSNQQAFPAFKVSPYKKTSIGGNLETLLFKHIFRVELAYDITSRNQEDLHIPKSDLDLVLNLEKDKANTKFIFQYILKYCPSYTNTIEPEMPGGNDPTLMLKYANDMIIYEGQHINKIIFNQLNTYNHSFSLSIIQSLLYEQLELSFTTYYNHTARSYLILPMISYKIDDTMNIKIGYHYMNGEEGSIFYLSKSILNNFFTEFKVNF